MALARQARAEHPKGTLRVGRHSFVSSQGIAQNTVEIVIFAILIGLAVNQGTLYPVLLKLEQEGAITSEWGTSENNRRARFYRLTRAGRKQLEAETRDWQATTALIDRFFAVKAEDLQ